MNSCCFIGRVCNEITVNYTAGTQMAVCNFTLAVKRPGRDETDFPRIAVYGKAAENCGTYLKKGRLCGVEGRFQTGSYTNKEGATVYTSEFVANRVEFLEWDKKETHNDPIPSGFAEVDEDIPFA